MQDKNFLKLFSKNIKSSFKKVRDKKLFLIKDLNFESGYILAFSLIVVAITVSITLGVVAIISKEIFFSRLIDYSKRAYFAADAGLECAEYLDSSFKNISTGDSIFLNQGTIGNEETEFNSNLTNNVFAKNINNPIGEFTGIPPESGINVIKPKIYCASDGSYNKIFTLYRGSESLVKTDLESSSPASSYNIEGNSSQATTTFGFVIKSLDPNGGASLIVQSCALVKYVKTAGSGNSFTKSWSIISTGYSSCNAQDKNRVSRTIFRTSAN